MHICKNKYGVSKEKPIDLKIENLDRVSIPAKSVATFDVRHPVHGTTYGVVHSKLFLCTFHYVGRFSC